MKFANFLFVWFISTIAFLATDSAEILQTTEETITTTTVDADYDYDDDTYSSTEESPSSDEGDFFVNETNGDNDCNSECPEDSEEEESEGVDDDPDSVYGMDYYKDKNHGEETATAKPANLTEQINPDVVPMKPDAQDQKSITSPCIIIVLLILLFIFAYMAVRNNPTLRSLRRNTFRSTMERIRSRFTNYRWNQVRYWPENPPSYSEAMVEFQ